MSIPYKMIFHLSDEQCRKIAQLVGLDAIRLAGSYIVYDEDETGNQEVMINLHLDKSFLFEYGTLCFNVNDGGVSH